MIAMMGYAFRTKNEGNDIIEKLSYYPLSQQMFARFLIVMCMQFILVLPFNFGILGESSTASYIISSFVPLFFFGAVGFTSTIWFGQKIGLSLTLFVWLSQILFAGKDSNLTLFLTPENEHFYLFNLLVMLVSILLLGTMVWKERILGESK